MIRAGQLDRRVMLQSKSVTRDAMGGEIITWVNQVEVWARVEPLRGREFFAANKEDTEVTTRIQIYYRADITTAWRAVCEGTAYDITEIIDVELRHREMELMARKQQNA